MYYLSIRITHLLKGRLVDQVAKVIDRDDLIRLLVVNTISTTATIKLANVNAGRIFRNGIAIELRPTQRRAALELAPCRRNSSVEVDAQALLLLFLPKKSSSRRSRAAYFLIRGRHDGQAAAGNNGCGSSSIREERVG